MTQKCTLRERLSLAIHQEINASKFTEFFDCFCQRLHQYRYVRDDHGNFIRERKLSTPTELKHTKLLNDDETEAFSLYCGYDLRQEQPKPFR